MKYKVGDKVRIRKDLVVGRAYGGLGCVPSHKEYCGRILTIEGSESGAYQLINGNGLWWSEEMFEDVSETGNEDNKIVIEVRGNMIIAWMKDKRGEARCSPEDKFDIFVGAKLALERLEEECKPYSWLKEGVTYYYPCVGMNDLYDNCAYTNSYYDKRLMNRGLVFKTKKEAVDVAKKMLAAVKESDSNGK